MESIYANYRLTFLYIERYRFSEEWLYSENAVPYCLYRYILAGSAFFTVNDIDYQVTANDIFFIPQGCRLFCRAITEIEFISIRFVGSSQIGNINLLEKLFGIPLLTHCYSETIKDYFVKMYQAVRLEKKYKMFAVRGYLELITFYLAHETVTVDERNEEKRLIDAEIKDVISLEQLQQRAEVSTLQVDPRITAVVDYLITHPNLNITITELSARSEMSESSFRRLFKKQTGKTPSDFMMELKMMGAARRLLIGDERISTIAYELGFELPNYFTRCFKSVFGVSPSEYRKRSQGL